MYRTPRNSTIGTSMPNSRQIVCCNRFATGQPAAVFTDTRREAVRHFAQIGEQLAVVQRAVDGRHRVRTGPQ